MIKKRVLFAAMMLTAAIGVAQSITVSFTGRNSNDSYRQLTEVRVENVTRGWSQTLTYPDTTLILNIRQSIDEVEKEEGGLMSCYPNPFAGHTSSMLTLCENERVTIELIRVTGQRLTEWSGELPAGQHRIGISLSETQVAFLCVQTTNHRWVAKMVNNGSGGSNKIEVGEYVEHNTSVAAKAVAEGEFQPGDEMHYTGVCQDALAATVTRLQHEDELIVFEFTDIMPPLDLPTVTTNAASAVTDNSAICGGNVTADGNAPVTARGVCWSTSHYPTVAAQHTSDGSGTGTFTSSITGLTDNTTYYVRAYATNEAGTAYGEEREFTTAEASGPELPTVTTTWIESVTAESATCGGQVTSDGGAEVTAKGVCWSTNPTPTVNDSHTNDGTGLGTFNSIITGLTYSTRYYVRAYATNEVGTAYGAERTFVTNTAPELPTVTTSPVTMWTNNICQAGGNVTNDGNSEVTDRGVCWSTSHNPTLSDSHISDGFGGTGQFLSVITGLSSGEIYFLRAYATNSVGTAYGEERVFIAIASGGAFDDVGATEAFFSVDSNRVVRFSKGNLQYQASTGLWRFADQQYDYIGDGNANISETYDGWIDLFGWGTSGWNSGAVCYQPWATGHTIYDYCPGGYGATGNELTGDYANADWGVYNAISNGGNHAGMWKTMTYSEFKYLLFDRDEPFRFAKATVNGIKGLIIFPDDFMRPGTIVIDATSLNVVGSNFSQNIYTVEQWEELENSGCVFLPASGERYSSLQLVGVGASGHYWTSSKKQNPYYVWGLAFYASDYTSGIGFGDGIRNKGNSVRLVREVSLPEVTTAEVDNISTVTAWCGGTVTNDGGGCHIVRGVCWSTSANPTVADSHTLDGIGEGDFVSVMTDLEIGTTYHVRAYAMNDNIGIAYGEDRTFTTRESLTVPTVEIETIEYTRVDGADVSCNVTDNGGANITARGICWSLNAEPTIADAHTTDQPGMGQYRSDITSLENTTTYHVRAYATNSVGTAYSRDTTITTPYANRDAFDHYGASIAVFSVSDTMSVRFSKGNLQYTNVGTHTVATGDTMPGTWRFAEQQYDCLVEGNANISDSYTGWIDLFGWGTSGWNSGAVRYMPYDTSVVSDDYLPGGSTASDLTGEYAFADWGVFNAIQYSGNQPGQWRTMTRYEWNYLLNTRNASTVGGTANARYALAKIDRFIGLIIFPDVFTVPTEVATPVNINRSTGAFCSANTYSAEDWQRLESAGAIFLTAAGTRTGSEILRTDTNGVPWTGIYWTATHSSGTVSACIVDFMNGYLHGNYGYGRNAGVSVRLVKDSGLPTVTTDTVSGVTSNSFTCGGTVTSSGNTAVTERGLCWDTLPNPSIAGRHTSYVSGTEHFTTGIAGLTRRTTYYVRAYATNSAGTAYGQERVFTTAPDASELAVVTTAEVSDITVTGAACGGSVTAEGMGEVTAKGVCWSISHNPTVANSHTEDGTGLGDFTSTITGLRAGTTYYVRAYATNSVATSYGEEYELITPNYTSSAFDADGASIALFSVSDTSSVHFSKGNLQYTNEGTHAVATGDTVVGTWRFAENQYDYVGEGNANISSSYTGWIDLFSWGTSGWNSGAVEYMPYSTSNGLYDYEPGGGGENDLTGDYAFADWGVYNAISNGGNIPEMWRTLTFDEWCYLLFGRGGSQLNGNDSARYVKAQVAEVSGLIIFPDNYSHPDNVALPTNINSTTAGYISNIYSSEAWISMEEAGAIFLPAAGSRRFLTSSSGYYSTATHGANAGVSKGLQFASTYFITGNYSGNAGMSVRLVKNHIE